MNVASPSGRRQSTAEELLLGTAGGDQHLAHVKITSASKIDQRQLLLSFPRQASQLEDNIRGGLLPMRLA